MPQLASRLHWNDRMSTHLTGSKSAIAGTPYRVRAGDTLFGIGQRYGLSVAELKRLNPRARRSGLYPGQPLILNACAASGCG